MSYLYLWLQCHDTVLFLNDSNYTLLFLISLQDAAVYVDNIYNRPITWEHVVIKLIIGEQSISRNHAHTYYCH